MIQIELIRPHVKERAKELVKHGGSCCDYEVLGHVCDICEKQGIEDVEFIRREDEQTPIVWGLDIMRDVIDSDSEVRPYEKRSEGA